MMIKESGVNMDNQLYNQIKEEKKRIEEAISKTNSPYLKRDYGKRLRKLRRKLYESKTS